MSTPPPKLGSDEFRVALRRSYPAIAMIGLLSFFVNLLVLTGSIYSLQVYDRVLSSRSEATLVVLTGLVVMLYFLMGVMDHVRGRIAARIGARFQSDFDPRVFSIALDRTMLASHGINTSTALRDLDSIQRALSSPAIFSVFDVPWTPAFIFVIFMFHPWLGAIAVVGGLILIVLTWLNQNGTKDDQEKAMNAARLSEEMTTTLQREADTVRALGMRGSSARRWLSLREDALAANTNYSDSNGFYATTSKTFRIFLQSAVLGMGAWLAIRGEITSGAMLASSIIVGRALSPIEAIIGQWALINRAWQGRAKLIDLLAKVPPDLDRTKLPKPRAILDVQNISVVPPGERIPTLRNLSFELRPGQALGVIGQSGSGKSTLARVLTGVWPIQAGKIRLDGASIEQYGHEDLANYVGYLPQEVALFEGTIAENIARLAINPDSEQVVTAAQKAAAHELVLKLPGGYDTRLPPTGQRLSGGQKQRIGLARALYGDPCLLVLDEPNANLDAEGSAALNTAIRNMKADGRSVVIMAHRPAAIEECDLLMILEGGNLVAFGPRDEVLKAHLKNAAQISQAVAGQNGNGTPPAPAAQRNPTAPQGPRPGGTPAATPAKPAAPQRAALPPTISPYGIPGLGIAGVVGKPPQGPDKPAETESGAATSEPTKTSPEGVDAAAGAAPEQDAKPADTASDTGKADANKPERPEGA